MSGGAFGGLDGFAALASPAVNTSAGIQGGGSAPNGMRLGLTTAPTGYKAPQFEFGTVPAMGATAADPPTFTCTPTWKEHVDEGTNVCWYLAAGKHKSITPSGGKDVYLTMSAAMSALDQQAEREHADDIKQALRHLHQGGRDAPEGSRHRQDLPVRRDRDGRPEARARRHHGQPGPPGTGQRPDHVGGDLRPAVHEDRAARRRSWHTFGVTGPPAVTPTQIVHTVAAGSTSIGAKSSADLIVY